MLLFIDQITNNVPYLIDLGSNSGTKLNGRRVLKHALKPGDVIHIGKTDLLFDGTFSSSTLHSCILLFVTMFNCSTYFS